MSSLIESALSYLSKALGLESVSTFPVRHVFAHTNWDSSYFDIPYGTEPEEIERRMCIAIGNTPTIFEHINNPTPRMQRALLNIVAERVRRNDRSAGDLMLLLVNAYGSRLVQEPIPGLRTEIEASAYEEPSVRVQRLLAFLASERVVFNVIDLIR